MRKFFLIQAIIIVLGVVSLLLVRNNVHDYRLLVTGDETAVADLPARLHFAYNEDANASSVQTAEEQRAAMQKASEQFGYETMVVLAESKGDNRYADSCTVYSMEIKQVLEGDTTLEGQTIDLIRLNTFSQIITLIPQGQKETELHFQGGVNYLKKGHTYLVAIKAVPLPAEQVTLYQILNFSYDLQNTENRLSDSPNCIYSDYHENEVFYCKQEMVDAYHTAKQDMFDYYGISTKDEGTLAAISDK